MNNNTNLWINSFIIGLLIATIAMNENMFIKIVSGVLIYCSWIWNYMIGHNQGWTFKND